jgi:hypothetical protein
MNDKSDPKSVLTWFYFILAPPLLFNHVCFNFDFFTNMIFLEVQSYQLEFASLKRKGKLVYHGVLTWPNLVAHCWDDPVES